MNYICTWFCADNIGEESIYPQTGELSSSESHQAIYWRCLLVFFMTSRKFNPEEIHLFFTNTNYLPVIDGQNVGVLLDKLGIQIIITDFKYKTPNNYYDQWKNQFYEFSILEYISNKYQDDHDHFLILDSDCVFIKPARNLFSDAIANGGFLSYIMDYDSGKATNGLSRMDLKHIYTDLLNQPVNEIPDYHAGEFFLCSLKTLKLVYADFEDLWPQLLTRNSAGLSKFNEEAHTLSYLYFKNNLKGGGANSYIKRLWTNPVFFRNTTDSDSELTIWHLPAEKVFGIPRLFDFLVQASNLGLDIPEKVYISIIQKKLGVPKVSVPHLLTFYFKSYYRASKKRVVKRLTSIQAEKR